jgi:hypothetical protein
VSEFKSVWDQLRAAGLRVIAFETLGLETLHLQIKCPVAVRGDGAFAVGSEEADIDSYFLFTADGTMVRELVLLNLVNQAQPEADRRTADAVDSALRNPVIVVSL